jgi:hypothetical protein
MAHEFDFRVEGLTKDQAAELLDVIVAFAEYHGAKVGGGYSEPDDEPEVDDEHSNVYVPEPLTEELEELYAHPRSCNCPYCSGEPDLDPLAAMGPDPIYDHDSNLDHFSDVETEALADMGLTNKYLVQFETEDDEGLATLHRFFVPANTSGEALERTLRHMEANDITSADGTPAFEITEVNSIPILL